jgi:hypothetical protein
MTNIIISIINIIKIIRSILIFLLKLQIEIQIIFKPTIIPWDSIDMLCMLIQDHSTIMVKFKTLFHIIDTAITYIESLINTLVHDMSID